jgi:hypothetical protein
MSDSINKISKENFHKFCKYEGCDHIASEYALFTLLKLCKRHKVTSVLEIGLGIGCIVDTIQKYYAQSGNQIFYSGTENNNFCLKALRENVNDIDSVKIYETIMDVPNDHKYDLLIIDGGDKNLEYVNKLINDKGIIYIEGFRGSQIEAIKNVFPKILHTEIISIKKNKKYSPFIQSHWMGGGQLLFINPTLGQRFHWLEEKLKTKLKYKIRFFKNKLKVV